MSRRKGVRAHNIHPGKLCGPCCLCDLLQPSYTHLTNMNEGQAGWLLRFHQPSPTDCICRHCAEDVRKHVGDPQHSPVWLRGRNRMVRCCMVVNCTDRGAKTTDLAPAGTIQEVLGCELDSSCYSNPVTLCTKHYQKFYTTWNTPNACTACGRRPTRKQKQFIRRCPDPDLITKFLANHCNFDSEIKQQDNICKSCYNFHLYILHEAASESYQEDLELKLRELDRSLMNCELVKVLLMTVLQKGQFAVLHWQLARSF